MIGNIVKVTVDRPLGSYHPKHKDIYYPINYGYIEGIMTGHGPLPAAGRRSWQPAAGFPRLPGL